MERKREEKRREERRRNSEFKFKVSSLDFFWTDSITRHAINTRLLRINGDFMIVKHQLWCKVGPALHLAQAKSRKSSNTCSAVCGIFLSKQIEKFVYRHRPQTLCMNCYWEPTIKKEWTITQSVVASRSRSFGAHTSLKMIQSQSKPWTENQIHGYTYLCNDIRAR